MLVKHVWSDVKPAFLAQRKLRARRDAIMTLGAVGMSFACLRMSFACVRMSFDVRFGGQRVLVKHVCSGVKPVLFGTA